MSFFFSVARDASRKADGRQLDPVGQPHLAGNRTRMTQRSNRRQNLDDPTVRWASELRTAGVFVDKRPVGSSRKLCRAQFQRNARQASPLDSLPCFTRGAKRSLLATGGISL